MDIVKREIAAEAVHNEQMLIERQNRDRDTLMNAISDLMWSVDVELRLIAANEAFIGLIKQFTGIEIQAGFDMNI